MPVETSSFTVNSGREMEIINITGKIKAIVADSGIKEGVATIFISGSTASVSTIEFEPNLVSDMKAALERLAPSDIEYKHHETWGGGGIDGLDKSEKAVVPHENGKSHVRATFMGPSLSVPFKAGKLLLGTWQQIVCLDFDVPARTRDIFVTLIGE